MAENYLLLDSTGQSINSTLMNIHTALTTQNAKLDTQNANIAAWAGTLSSLTTGDKSSLVAAINWVLGQHTTHTNTSAMHDVYAYLDSVSNAENGAAIHNSLPRCKNLGSALTADQHARIADHTFKGLWVGDYIGKSITFTYTNSSDASATATAAHKFRFWDMDYWRNCGDTATTEGHILGGPDAVFFTNKMNDTNNTTGGYYNSKMVQTYLEGALNAFKALVGENHILTHRDLLTNATSNGYASGHAWYSTQIDLLNEPMVYGGYHAAAANTGTSTTSYAFRNTVGTQQLSLFRFCKNFSFIRANWYWLRDVASAGWFAGVSHDGNSSFSPASYASGGVRPFILLK